MTTAVADKAKLIQNVFDREIKRKKLNKCKDLFNKHKQKKYKKFVLSKQFTEFDSDSDEKPMNVTKKAHKDRLTKKFRDLVDKQHAVDQVTNVET